MAATYPLGDYPNGDKWTGKHNGARQCKGFAYLIFDLTYGIANGEPISEKTFTNNDTCKTAFSDIKAGAMVDFTWKSGTKYAGTNHSVIITAKSSNGVSVYDCNFSAADTIGSRTWRWADMVSRFDVISGGLNP